jgi:hypothetical protein
MKTIVTHIFPDLDAITSAWLLTRFLPDWEEAEIAFTPQQKNWNNIVPDSDPNILYCDTGYGKFDHHQIKERTCASRRILDYLIIQDHISNKEKNAVKRIVDYVTDIDNFGEVHYPDPAADKYDFCLHQLITGLKKKGMADLALVQTVFPLLDGVLQLFIYKGKAEAEIVKGFVFTSKYGKSLAMNTGNDEAMRLAQKMGFSLVVMKDPQKLTARIKTLPSPELDLTPVYEEIMKVDKKGTWFLHILKNMLLNGSSRTPDSIPTPLSLKQLIEIIREI